MLLKACLFNCRVNIINNSTVIFTGTGTGTYTGVISGTGNVIHNSGATTFTGAHTYSGGTRVNGGYLTGTTASLQGDFVVNGNLTFDQDFDGAFSGDISGTASAVPFTGGLTKQGSGTVTLAGTNTYNGGTRVQAGTLQGNTASLQGAIDVALGAAVIFDQGADGTYSGNMSGWGSLTKNGAGTLTLSGTNTYSGDTYVNAGSLQGNTTSLQGTIRNQAAVVFDQGSDGTYAGVMLGTGSLTKSGNGTMTLSGSNTYSGGTTVSAGKLAGTTSSLQGNIANNAGVIFDQAGNGTYAGVMSGTGSLTKSGTGTVTLTGTNTYSGGTTVGAGTLQGTTASLQGGIANNAAVVFDQGSEGTYAGVMSGTGSLTKNGTGTVALTGSNTHSGGTVVNGGTLAVGADNHLGSGAGGLAFNGGTLRFDGGFTTSRAVALNAGGGTLDTNGRDVTLTGVLSGAGGLTKSGVGNLTLSGANTYSGGTTVNAGTLQGGTTSLQGGITNNAAVVFDQNTSGTYAGVMSGTGSLTKAGTGIVALSGTNTYIGGTTVSAGTLQGTTTSLQGSITNNATVVFDQFANGTYADIMSGTGRLTKSGAGTVTLTGSNTYSGGTTVSAGNLQGNSTSLQGNIANAAALTFDQVADGTYAGIISGTGSFNKTGAGSLNLTGAHTYSGPTTVTTGILAVNGSLAGSVGVGAAGTLGGTGTMGAVTVGGTLAPGNSIGTLRTGNLAFNAGSVYAVEVDAAGNSDRTNVTGTVSLGDATLSVLAATGNYALATNYTIITNDAADAVTGTFGTLNSNLAFLEPSVNYAGGDGNDVILNLTRNAVGFTNVATTPNEAAVAAALEHMVAGASGDTLTVLTALNGLSASGACRAYNEIGGAGGAAFIDTGIAGMTRYFQMMTARMGALRAGSEYGAPAFAAEPLYLAAGETGMVSDMDPALFALGNASPLTPDKNWGLWAQGVGMWGQRSNDDVTSHYHYSLGGFTLGVDGRISDEFIVGFSAGYLETDLDFDQMADTGESDSYRAAVYGDYSAGAWYLDTILSYASNGYETSRVITVGGTTRTASGDFDGRELAAYVEGGYVVTYKNYFFRPLAAFQLTHIILDEYTETGAGALNLTVNERTADSYLGSFGMKVSRPFTSADNWRISPEIQMRWAHEFSNDDRVMEASFAGAPGASFVVHGDEPVKDSAIIGLGINTLFKENFNFYLNYDVNVSRDHTNHSLVGGLRYMWE